MLRYEITAKSKEERDSIGVDINSLMVSVGLAILHMGLGMMQLNFEARACHTSLLNYCIVCFNGRFDWVPFIENIVTTANVSKEEFEDFDDEKLLFDFDNIVFQNSCLYVQVHYKFSDVGVNSLCKAIVDLPAASRQFTIKLGECIEDLNAHELY